jgi:hypothetical protein
MGVEDKMVARELLREFNRRRNIDVSDVKISVSRGIGFVGGVIRAAPGESLDPKVEMKAIQESARRISGLKGLTIEARFDTSSKK